MHTIKITYRRFFRIRTIETTFPEAWSEMNARQFTALYKRPDDISLLSLMLRIPKRIVRKLSLLQIYDLTGLFDFIRRDTKVSSFILDQINCRSVGTLFSPKPRLAEMPFAQFIYADSFYMQYVETLRPEILRDLVAHLYVPGSGYDKNLADRNASRLKHMDQTILEAIALNYGLVRKWIVERYPLVFPAGKETAARGKGCKTVGGWSDVFDNLVGDDLKDRDKYADIPVNSVFRFITKKIKEARKNATKV